jgi:hypothetical protein
MSEPIQFIATTENEALQQIERHNPQLIPELYHAAQKYPRLAELVVSLWCEKEELQQLFGTTMLTNKIMPELEVRVAIESIIAAEMRGLAIFYKLAEEGMLSISEICAQLSSDSAVMLVSGLIQKKLAEIRGHYLFITPEGYSLASKMMTFE